MTRVNEALAKAAMAGAGVPRPVDGSAPPRPGLPLGNLAELWPPEDTPERVPRDGQELGQTPSQSAPQESPAPAALARAEREAGGKLVARDMDPRSIEQYRRLAARLYLAQTTHATGVVMITSALAGEGKTLTATNLALTMSESYKKRVLLIDADLRHPWIHELFRIPNVTGLNDGVRADTERKVPLIRMSEHLSIVTAGRPDPDPMSVFSSPRMRRVLQDASAAFDWVIIDTPPVGLLSDAHLLSSLVDTVVLVVKVGATPLHAIKTAISAVGHDRIAGVVLNCADDAQLRGSYDYYAQSYPRRPVIGSELRQP